MYSDKAEINEDNLTKMLYIGKKYQVHSLIIECCAYVKKILTVDNACAMFEVSHTYSEPGLHRSVLQFIEDNLADVYRSQTFKDLCRECFGEVLDLDEICCEEADEEEDEEDQEEEKPNDPYNDPYDDPYNDPYNDDYDDPHRSRSSSRSRSSRSSSSSRSRSRSRSRSLDRGSHPEEDAQEDSEDEATDDSDEPLEYHEDESVNLERQQFNMLVYWTDSECEKQGLESTGENRRLVAGDLVTKIRYGLLDSEFVVRLVSETGLLSMEQQCKVMKSLLCSEITKNVFWKGGSRALHSSALLFPRFDKRAPRAVVTCSGVEAISIKCFEDIYFHGFTLFKKALRNDEAQEYSVSARITNEKSEVLSKVDLNYDDVWRTKDEEEANMSVITPIIFRKNSAKGIWFNRKVLLKKNCKYNILADIAGPQSYSGEFNDSAITRFSEKFPVMHWDDKGNERKIVEVLNYEGFAYSGSTTVNGGQIPDLAFSFVP